jgi:hypothetical protein
MQNWQRFVAALGHLDALGHLGVFRPQSHCSATPVYFVEAILPCPTVMARDDVAADISALFTGTHSNITATDQIRPIATTTAIPMHVRICHTLCVPLSLLPSREPG